jgi:S-adenosylmethionine hydrolase
MRLLGLLTDYGAGSEHVGAIHAVLARGAPGADRIDLAHDLPPGRVRWASLVLGRMARLLGGDGVVVAVVDPGVGSGRRALVVRTAEGIDLVGPDNGLLAPAVHSLGGVTLAIELRPPHDAPPTFHGRDVFAPAAAALASGTDPGRLGVVVDPASLVSPDLPAPEVQAGLVATEVAGWDRFGNLATLATSDALAGAGLGVGDPVVVGAGASERRAVVGRAFADVPAGDLLVHVDSHGWVAVAVNRGDAASALAAEEGMRIRLRGTSPIVG